MDRGFPQQDFRDILLNVWMEVLGVEPTSAQYDIAHYIERGPDPSRSPWEFPNNLIFINAFRGVGKSWETSAFVPHALNQWRDLDVLVCSASSPRAVDFSIFTKRLIHEMPWWKHMAPPDPLPPNFKDKIDAFDVFGAPMKHAPSVKSLGITGQITGSRADLAILDDVESLNNSMTVAAREVLILRIQEIIGAVLKPGGRVIVLGTQQGVESIYGKFPEFGFKKRIWPVLMPDTAWMQAQGEDLAPSIANSGLEVGEPTDPQRFDADEIRMREARYGRSGFQLQFMLDTRLADETRFPLKCSDLIVTDLDKDKAHERYTWGRGRETELRDLPCLGLTGDRWWGPMATHGSMQPYQGKAMFIDPSGTGSDELAYSVLGHLAGTLFLLDNGGFRHGYAPSTLEGLAMIAKHWGCGLCVYEPNFGAGMFESILRPVFKRLHPHCSIKPSEWAKGQKELRIIDTLEPVMNQHRLVVNRSIVEADAKIEIADLSEADTITYRLFHQMTRLTRERGCLTHDDRLESVAIGVSHYANILRQDEDETLLARREDRVAEELERFARSFDKHSTQEQTWLSPLDPFSQS